MFLKPFRVKTQTLLKGSGRKKLRADVGAAFPSLSQEDLTEIIPGKEEISMIKVQLSGGDVAVFYSLQKKPIFFEHHDKLYPTVYLLWGHPDLLPVFTTWPPVLSKMAAGADLMLPGLYTGGQGVTPKTFSHIKKGDKCAVNLATNRAPVAVGEAAMSGEDMYLSNMRGKGVIILHVVGDQLWASGDMSDPPFLGDLHIGEGQDGEVTSLTHDPEVNPKEEEEGDAEGGTEGAEGDTAAAGLDELRIAGDGQDSEADEVGGLATKGQEVVEEDEEAAGAGATGVGQEGLSPSEEMDALLVFCFKCALKAKLKKSDIPLLTSNFYKNFMVPCCPSGKVIDLKKSSYKKLSKFLEEMQRQGYLSMRQVSKGVDQITSMDKSHQDLRDFEMPELEDMQAGAAKGASDECQALQISDLFCVNAAGLTILKDFGFRKGDALNRSELRKVVTEYIQAHNLQDPERKEYVVLDPLLADMVLNKNENNTHMKWEAVYSRFGNKLQQAYEVRFPGKPPVVKKGSPTPIKITTQNRGGNKKVTLVENVESFGIDPHTLAHTVQLAVQCSTSVGEKQEILIQGNQVACLADLLLDKYKIPRRFIQGLELAPKNKRR